MIQSKGFSRSLVRLVNLFSSRVLVISIKCSVSNLMDRLAENRRIAERFVP